MKTQIKNTLLGTLLLIFALPKFVLSQNALNCPFKIINHRNCDVTVHFEVSDCNGNSCGGTQSGVVASNTAAVILTGGSISVPSCYSWPYPGFPTGGTCGAGGDVFVWLKEINYIDVTGGSNSESVSGGNCLSAGHTGPGATGSSSLPAAITSPCNSPSTYKVIWSANGVDIW